MKVIGNMKELLCLDCDLVMFILSSCPWIAEGWEPQHVGFIFLLEDGDIHEV